MENVSAEEIAIEKEMAELGVSRYRSRIEKAMSSGLPSATPAGRYLLQEACSRLVVELNTWIATAKKRRGKRHSAVEYLTQLDSELVSFLTVRSALNTLGVWHERTTLLRASEAVGNELQAEVRYRAMRREARQAWTRTMAKVAKSTPAHKRKALRGVMSRTDLEIPSWPKRERIKAGLVLLELLRQSTGLFEVKRMRPTNEKGKRGRFATNILVLTEATTKWLEESKQAHEALFPIYMPTLQPPVDWEDPYSGGYHTNLLNRQPLVKTRDRGVLRLIERDGMPEVYGAVNAMQQTAWEINPDVLMVLRDLWESGSKLADLVSRDDEPLPNKPQDLATNEEAKRAWKRAAAGVYARNVAVRSQRVQTAKLLFMSTKYEGKRFFYPYQADFRGRLYCLPYFLQPQGTGQARGLLRFADGRPITQPSEVRWLAIHGANCWGFDKVPLDDRAAWVSANEANILRVYHDPLDCLWWTEAEKPWEFLAFCLEWGNFKHEGWGFVSKLPIAMDGSNNGLQVFSLLLRDPIGAAATNCAPSAAPRDIYQDVADLVTAKLIRAESAGDDTARRWLQFCTLMANGRLPRECAKRPVMTLPYGSTRFSCQKYVQDWYLAARRGVAPVFEHGTDYKACQYLAELVWASIAESVSAATSCMAWLREVASICFDHKVSLLWHSPSGFPIRQAYSNRRMSLIRTAVGDVSCVLAYKADTNSLSKRRQLNGISPNFIHSLDASALVKTVNSAHAAGITNFAMIHDSFGTTCVEADAMAQCLRDVYATMFSRPLLEDFRTEIQRLLGDRAQLPAVPAMGTFDVNDVRRSVYFFA